MPTINQLMLMGRLCRDPELRYTQTGTPITDLHLAVNAPPRKDRETVTNFFFVTVFGKQAESVVTYTVKGQEVLVNGRLQTRQWHDDDGNTRSRTEIIGHQITFGHRPRKSRESLAA